MPFTPERIDKLIKDEKGLGLLDQIAYRYIKLQDTLGKLIRTYFLLKGENVENLTMIDIIVLAERVGLPIDENLWTDLKV